MLDLGTLFAKIEIDTKDANNNLQDIKQYSKTSNKVLGYGVDKDGFFTSDFNEAAGLPILHNFRPLK